VTRVEFSAEEYRADQSFQEARFAFEGSPSDGWSVLRDGAPHLELGPGYRLLETELCGVCSTDLARHFLPFPLPQVTGHEIVARDPEEPGERYVVEINASHRARGVAGDCPWCTDPSGALDRHCPARVVLGIHDLPGGFGPWFLAPVDAALPVPDALPTETAVLVEPFAAALNGVERIAPRSGDRVAVLGPRRLGQLVVAALAGWRERAGVRFEIHALTRHRSLLDLARELGADGGVAGDLSELEPESFDVVVDTTGNPDALATAVRLARREVHLKSTHGQPSCGLGRLTELVVDELALAPLPDHPGELAGARVAWLATAPPPDAWRERVELLDGSSEEIRRRLASGPPGRIARADAAVVDSGATCDRAIRPSADDEEALLLPRGTILFHTASERGSPLVEAITGRGLVLSSSRCGDFRRALDLLAGDERLRDLGKRFVTHRFERAALREAFEVARTPACIKAVVGSTVSGATPPG
jgi:threonine dehydrogenase-like Zn-dependent dehydrogenase